MKFVKTLVFAAFAYSASNCYAVSNSDAELVKTINLVQKLSGEMQCEAKGKSYSLGAVIVIDKATFQCIQVFPNPHDANATSTAWVQMLLSAQSRSPAGLTGKK